MINSTKHPWRDLWESGGPVQSSSVGYMRFNCNLKTTPATFQSKNISQEIKGAKRLEKIEALKQLAFPLQNDEQINELLDWAKQFKNQFHIYGQMNDDKGMTTHQVNVQGTLCNIDIMPTYRITAPPEGITKRCFEIFFSFPFPENIADMELDRHISKGTLKEVCFAWLIGKNPQVVAKSLTNFLPNEALKESEEEIEERVATRRNVSNREAQILQSLQGHPSFPSLYKCAQISRKPDYDQYIMIMKYYPIDLRDYLHQAQKKLKDLDKTQMAIEIMQGIKHLHDRKILHGDIKPENILLNDKREMVICDFGASYNLKKTRDINFCLGTLDYMPWEVLEDFLRGGSNFKRLTEKQILSRDIWAVGAILYHLYLNEQPASIEYIIKNEKDLLDPSIDDHADMCEELHKLMQQFSENEPPQENLIKHLIWKMMHIEPDMRPTNNQILEELELIKNEQLRLQQLSKRLNPRDIEVIPNPDSL